MCRLDYRWPRGQIDYGPAAARLVSVFGAKYNPKEGIGRAHGLLKVMDVKLESRPFMVGNGATLADIAAYSNVSAAPEGDVDRSAYANVCAWLARIWALPGFVPFQKSVVGMAA